jgi:hypothetical protein
MLSYEEHGKFRTPTQGRTTKKPPPRPIRLDFCDVPLLKWIMGRASAQWSIALR